MKAGGKKLKSTMKPTQGLTSADESPGAKRKKKKGGEGIGCLGTVQGTSGVSEKKGLTKKMVLAGQVVAKYKRRTRQE